MAFFFGDGFDLYTALADGATYWDAALGPSATLTIAGPAGRFTGSRCLIPATSNTTPYLTKTSGQNDSVHHVSLAFNQTAALSGTLVPFFFTLYDGASAQCTVVFRTDGAIILTAGIATAATIATYTGAVAANNTWYQFEIEIVISNTAGSIAVRKLGNTSNDFFLGSLNTRNGSTNAYANKIGIGANNTTAQLIDDFLWRSDASSVAWLGDIRCYTRMPATDASIQWTPSASFIGQAVLTGLSAVTLTAGQARSVQFTAAVTGSISSLTLSLNTGPSTANLKAAIYNAAGTTLLATSNQLALSAAGAGPQTITFPTPLAVTKGTVYWLAYDQDASITIFCSLASAGAGAISCGFNNSVTYASFPPANVVTGWTASGGTTPTTTINYTSVANAQFVGEAQQDGATTYAYSSTVGQNDLYGLASLSATPSAIIGVTTRAYMQKSDAGTRIAAVQLQSGASNVQGSLTLNTTFGWASRNDLVDPATSAAWTATGVNNATIGVVVTT